MVKGVPLARQRIQGEAFWRKVAVICVVLSIETKTTAKKTTSPMMSSTTVAPRH